MGTLEPDPKADKRFWSKVDRQEEDDCWLWGAAENGLGYGIFTRHKKRWYAHRLSYTMLVGPIPEGLVIDHLCRNPGCVNPKHLEPVTHRENCLRGESFCAKQARRTHCPQGHEYTPENTYLYKRVHGKTMRHCRACNRERSRKRRQREKKSKEVLQGG